MTNIVYQEIGCPVKYVYMGQDKQKKNDRIQSALKELEHTGDIAIYLYKRGKLRRIAVRRI